MPPSGWPAPGEEHRVGNTDPRTRLVLPDAGGVNGFVTIDEDPGMPGFTAPLPHRADQRDGRACEGNRGWQPVRGDRAGMAAGPSPGAGRCRDATWIEL